jgi:glycosyltransferase involved in cell wall biosynthesis
MRKPRSLGNFSIETSYRTMHAAWPAGSMPPDIHVASRFTAGFSDRLRIRNEVRDLRHPVIHITGDIHFAAIGLGGRPTILTIHDLGMLDEGNALARWVKRKFWLDWPLRSCDRLIAVSERTKEDILARTPYPSDRITVIPSVISPTFRARAVEPRNEVPRILHIGLAENKNLDRHAEALAGLNVHLRIIGEPSMEQHAMLKNHGLEYSHASKLSEEEIQAEYAAADLLLFCSTLEGYGMPIIEAQTVGVPVVTSLRAPMDETAGEGALLADPEKVEHIRLAVERGLNSRELRRELITKGKANAERCSAAASARKHASLYAEVLREAD